jgi:hypothetical protein
MQIASIWSIVCAVVLAMLLILLFIFGEESHYYKNKLSAVNAQIAILAQANKEQTDRYREAQYAADQDVKKSQQNVTYIMSSAVSSDCEKALTWSLGQTKRLN